jgi:hypothetical protein
MIELGAVIAIVYPEFLRSLDCRCAQGSCMVLRAFQPMPPREITVIARRALFCPTTAIYERVIRLLHPYGFRNDKITVPTGRLRTLSTGKASDL